MWRCWQCGEMGRIEASLPDECPDCGASKEELYYWIEDRDGGRPPRGSGARPFGSVPTRAPVDPARTAPARRVGLATRTLTCARRIIRGMPTLTLDDATLWYEATGEGRPLVFVHGAWSDADAWRPQVEAFVDDYRVITVDVRGHGRSGGTDRNRYSVGLFTDDLERLLDHLGIGDGERPILCGLSLGGMIVQTYLDRHPDGAAAAILAGPVRSMLPIDLPAWLKRTASPLPALTASLTTMGSEATFRSLLGSIRTANGEPWLAADPSVRSQAISTAGEISTSEFRKVFAALYRFEAPDLSGLGTPLLVVYGDQEAPSVRRQGESIAAAVENGRTAGIPDAGHLVNLDNPEAFNATCREFLAETNAIVEA